MPEPSTPPVAAPSRFLPPADRDLLPPLRWTTLGELLIPGGVRLPWGIWREGRRQREMTFRTWHQRDDEWLGGLKQVPGMDDFGFLRGALGYLGATLGGIPLDRAAPADERPEQVTSQRSAREARIGQLAYGDALVAAITIRRLEEGAELRLEGNTCPAPGCGEEFSYLVDLDSLPVTELPDEAAPADILDFDHALIHPLPVRGQPVAKLRFGPPRLAALTGGRDVAGNIARVTGTLRRAALLGGCAPDDLADLRHADLRAIDREIGRRVISPNLSIADNCPKCRAPWSRLIRLGDLIFLG